MHHNAPIQKQQGKRRTDDMKELEDSQIDPLCKLEKCAIYSNQITDEDLKQLHLIIEAYRGWQVLGKAAKWLVMFLAGLSAFFVALGQLKEVLKVWLH